MLESIYGKPPPPPPPNVTRHQAGRRPTSPRPRCGRSSKPIASDAQCAACHRKIDPLGLAFDNYDAIGHWRTEEAVRDGAGANPTLDPSGELPDGRKFADADELKQSDAGRLRQVCRRLYRQTGHLCPAAGHDVRRSQVAGGNNFAGKSDDYRLATLIENLVLCDLFQHR